MRIMKFLLSAVGAAVLLVGVVGAASAGRLRASSSTFRIAFARVRLESEFNPINHCPITMEGSLHTASFAKAAAALVGYITRADLGGCAAGHVTILRETLPWHVRYTSFSGTLPAINRVTLDVVGFSIRTRTEFFELACLVSTTTTSPLRVFLIREVGGAISQAELEGFRILTSCMDLMNVIASGGVFTVPNAATRVTVTLI